MEQMKPRLSTSSLTVEEELVNDGLQTATCFINKVLFPGEPRTLIFVWSVGSFEL